MPARFSSGLSGTSSRPATPSPLSATPLTASSPTFSSLGSPSLEVNGSPVFGLDPALDDQLVAAELLKPVGCLEEDEYRRLMSGWRVALRQVGVNQLRREMSVLEGIQTRCRTPGLDVYFVQTSLLGTHTFFMIFIPMWFWFGYGDVGRGLLYVLAATGYVTSVIKDLCCIPRPFSPPVVRLSVGNHALEYGFPSTHSANSVSMALYFAELVVRHSASPLAPLQLLAYAFLAVMAFSVVFGRLYCGMHSLTDVTVGSLLGVAIWWGHWLAERAIERLTLGGSALVTGTIVPATLFLVFVHPAPAEDCPCFEDAVAFVSVVCGIVVGRTWSRVDYVETTVGAGAQGLLGSGVWFAAVLAKLVIGIAAIFAWRLIAKEVCHAILPPIFRLFSNYLLPRRHYLVATEYDKYKKTDGLHPVPSLLDLPSLDELEGKQRNELTGHNQIGTVPSAGQVASELRSRAQGVAGAASLVDPGAKAREKLRDGVEGGTRVEEKKKAFDHIKRDADVLTKFIVYSGIGYLATISMPALFAWSGLSV